MDWPGLNGILHHIGIAEYTDNNRQYDLIDFKLVFTVFVIRHREESWYIRKM